MRKLNLGTPKKRNTPVKKKNILTKRENMQDHIHGMYSNAKKMAKEAQSKLEGKKMIPHPTIPKAYIYVDC